MSGARLQVFTAQAQGWEDLESYVARVTTAENGQAPPEALRAQAIAARTYLLRSMRDDHALGTPAKPVPSGQQFQVEGKTATTSATEAATATAGLVITWNGSLILANYVAGAPDPTEKFVTINEGKSGDDVTPTRLSMRRPDNRGCMSQNGSAALARSGAQCGAILAHYYGADIVIEPLRMDIIPAGVRQEPQTTPTTSKAGAGALAGVAVAGVALALLTGDK